MKKILAIVMAVAMVMALSVTAFAAETEIALTSDNLGYYTDATEVDGGLNSSGEQFTVNLPETLEIGTTITLHIKGSSDGDFRVWLVDNATTASEQIYSTTDLGLSGGDFDVTIDLTIQNWNSEGATCATAVDFKGISYGTNLDNFTVTYLAIVTDGEEVAAETAEETEEASETAEETEEASEAAEETAEAAAEETTTTANADTGVVLAVLPMAVAAAAVVVSKRR
ncbi:MAG: acid shock protein [Oscillospiraceae bacterium]|nr:acid shock protein [Oscillospiraceae bacterium]